MRKLLIQQIFDFRVADYGVQESGGVGNVTDLQNLSRRHVILQILLQRFEIAPRFFFPAVVEKNPRRGEQICSSVFVVLFRLTENNLRDTAALVIHCLALILVVTPSLR